MILQLEQLALNYSKTMEGAKAREMLNYLKSDLTMEMVDDQGTQIKNNSSGSLQQESKQSLQNIGSGKPGDIPINRGDVGGGPIDDNPPSSPPSQPIKPKKN